MSKPVTDDARTVSEGEIADLTPVPRPTDAPLRGRLVSLVPLDPAAQVAALFHASHQPGDPRGADFWRWMGQGPFVGEVAMRAWLDGCQASSDPLFRAIVDNASGRPLGMAAFMAIRPSDRVLELGNIWMGHGLAQRPGATEAIFLMLQHAFALGYRRVEWKCNAANHRSRAAAERFGFRFEGIFWRHMIVKGRSRDTAWFSMLAQEWPARQVALAAWLAPDNFDADERQKSALAR